MKSKLLIMVVSFASITLLQGCYTILDLPEYTPSGYTSNDTPQPDVPGDPYPDPGPAPLPIIVPIVTISTPPSVETPRNGDTQSIRNDGNGRGSSGRNTDFSNTTRTSTVTESSSGSNTSSSSSNNSTRTSGTRNSGNGRR